MTSSFPNNTTLITEETIDIKTTPLSPWEDDYVVNTFFLLCIILMFFIGTVGNVLIIGKWYLLE